MQAEDVCWACRKIVGVVVGETVDDVAGFFGNCCAALAGGGVGDYRVPEVVYLEACVCVMMAPLAMVSMSVAACVVYVLFGGVVLCCVVLVLGCVCDVVWCL